MRYATRNHAFVPAVVWELGATSLRCEAGALPPREIPLADLAGVRLTFAPTRPEPNRYRCRLQVRDGQVLEFFNRTYRGPYDFADTSADYVAFVRALHAALPRSAPACRFDAGASPGRYALNWVVTIFSALMVVVAALFLLFHGLAWLILVKVVLLVIYAPGVVRWLARNKPRPYPPGAIPADVLPAPSPKISDAG